MHRVLSDAFGAYTILDGQGYWEGIGERSQIVVVITDKPHSLAETTDAKLREIFFQSCIGLASSKVDFKLI